MDRDDQKPSRGQIMGNNPALQGVSMDNFMSVFLMHSHDQSAMGGKPLYGPYFIKDSSDGHTYKLVSTNGVLSLTKVV